MDIEHALICEIVIEGDMSPVADARITENYFLDDRNRSVFKMILGHWHQYGTVPDAATIQQAYPTYRIEGYPEPIHYYVNSLRDRHQERIIMDSLSEVGDILSAEGEGRGEKLMALLQEAVTKSKVEVPVGRDEDVYTTALDWLLPILEERRQYGYLRKGAAQTGFPSIDMVTGGLQPEQLITLVGLPKGGKSSAMLKLAMNTRDSGHRILFVTFEMSIEEQKDRMASLIGNVSLTHILNGSITPAEQRRIEDGFKLRKSLEGFTMVHDRTSVMTVSGIRAKIQEYRPSIIYIDGVYLMDDENGEPFGSPRALTNITRTLKRLAQSEKVCIVISTQALAYRAKKGMTVDSIGYSSSFLQDSDVVLGVEQTPTQHISVFKVMASRSGPKMDTTIRVDWTQGLIEEVDPAVAGLTKSADGTIQTVGEGDSGDSSLAV
jgi:replicative DNA helicase